MGRFSNNNAHLIPDHLKWTADESVPLQLGLEELLGHGLPDVKAVGAAPGTGEELITIILSGEELIIIISSYNKHLGQERSLSLLSHLIIS